MRLSPRLRASAEASLARGTLPSDHVTEIMAALDWKLEQLMVALLPVAAARANIPISRHAVGAVALGLPRDGGPGGLYLGANFEFAGQVLGFTIHAEQSAVNSAWLHGEHGIGALAINAAPCGMCRQFLHELTINSTLRILTRMNAGPVGSHETQLLSRLLPAAFGPEDLGVDGGLMRAENHRFELETTEPGVLAALAACNASYAPYTHAYAGVALCDADGNVYAGRYAENAAYNSSLLAIQSALAVMRIQTGAAERLSISKAVLVERSVGPTSQRDVTRTMLESISPTIRLAYHSV